MYHGIHNAINDVGEFDANYSVTESVFREHLTCLRDNRYKVSLLREIDNADSDHAQVVLTFDDGDKSCIMKALPILLEFGMKAEFFVTTGKVGVDKIALDEADLRQLSAAGMSVQSHGVTHKFLTGLNDSELYQELSKSKLFIENITQQHVEYLSLPGGRGDLRVMNMAKSLGYEAICTSSFGINKSACGLFNLQRITIYRETSTKKLISMMSGKGIYYWLLVLINRSLDKIKTLLGDQVYDKLYNSVSKYR